MANRPLKNVGDDCMNAKGRATQEAKAEVVFQQPANSEANIKPTLSIGRHSERMAASHMFGGNLPPLVDEGSHIPQYATASTMPNTAPASMDTVTILIAEKTAKPIPTD